MPFRAIFISADAAAMRRGWLLYFRFLFFSPSHISPLSLPLLAFIAVISAADYATLIPLPYFHY
jgi:hypothetical protein